ncbi:DUF6541 family protein [Actinophytocola xanthii]|uniref:Glycosyltransferase RgtA/B/C/D-like domain-containing protein n=1 Tax=Actinophytocola xanthii TaxID=1912961 RepID=A0A1Q8CRQ7_9PSEU|nr:DUF6541 family protein [Actinophytocola xanthii]OLF17014.1 hypothetical protein BU204_13840 [Actinophytocola xanthii]
MPTALVVAAWLLVPGLVAGYLAGLRGIVAAGLAPVASIAIIAATAVVAGGLGLRWSVPVALAGVGVAVLLVAAVTVATRRWFPRPEADPRPVTLAALGGFVPALVLGTITILMAIEAPDTLSQTYDAVFHYNALAYIGDTGNASSLTLGTLGNTEVPPSFYPAAWHDLASLVMLSTGASIPLAANLVTAVGAVVVWPLACLLLARQVFGRNVAALVVTGVLSLGFTAFPWNLLGFGVLWPNLLGMAFAPALLAVVLTLTHWTRDDALGIPRAWLALVVGVVAAGLAHPNVLFSVAVLSVFPVGARLFERGWRLHREGRTRRGAAEVLTVLILAAVAWYWTATTPTFAPTRDQYWPPFETKAAAVGEVVLNATNKYGALWLLSLVVIVGALAGLRRTEMRLLLAGHVVVGFLFVLAAAVNVPETRKFTGYWYNDSHRLAAILPITGVPLAVGGILYLAGRILAATADKPDWRRRVATAPSVAVAVVLTAVLVVATAGLYPTDRRDRVSIGYLERPRATLVTAEMREFYDRIAEQIPADAVVAGNPFTGSSLLWALEDRKVLFPHFRAAYSEEQTYLAGHLDAAATDPEVCAAATDLGVEYLLVGGVEFRPSDDQWEYFEGLDDPGTSSGFELVDSSGPSKLYRLTACDTSAEPNG